MPGAFDPPMQVEFDRQIFVTQFKGGVGRYFAELIHTFRQNPDIGVSAQIHAPFIVNEMEPSSKIGKRIPHPFPSRVTRRFTPSIANTLCEVIPNRVQGAQIRHYTQYSLKYWKPEADVANVCTVYDMIPEKFPEYFPNGNPHQHKEFFARNCDLIICISETTRNDLHEVYGPLSTPAVVVPLGVGPPFTSLPKSPERPAWLPEGDFAIFVGNRAKYKDFSVVLQGLAKSHFGPQTLVCVGGGRVTDEDRRALDRAGQVLKVKFLSLSDSDLAEAYRRAKFYVSASRYEGFGLPTLEALACGCQPILSATPAHLEVGSGRALYFHVGNPDELAAQIDRWVTQGVKCIAASPGSRKLSSLNSLRNVAVDTANAYRFLLDA